MSLIILKYGGSVTSLSILLTCHDMYNILVSTYRNIDSEGIQVQVDMDSCAKKPNYIRHTEHVQAKVTLRYSRRGDIQLHLVSPNGTRSMVLQKRKNDYQQGEFRDWPFMSVHYWGEDPTGTWTLEVENVGSPLNTGQTNWALYKKKCFSKMLEKKYSGNEGF